MLKFQPKPGQIDYTDIKRCPVVNVAVKYGEKILIVKRSAELRFYPNLWNSIGGFLDDEKSVEEKAKEEIKEELGIGENSILSIKQGEIFEVDEPKYDKIWIIHPVLIEANNDKIVLDWEAQDYRWIGLDEVSNFEFVPGFKMVLEKLF